MTEKLKQKIKDETGKLPKENQEAISSLDWATIVEEISKKYLLNEVEVNNLQVETLLVLVGIENLDSYAWNIEKEVGTTKDEAEKIAKEVEQRIFMPIYDKLTESIKKSDKAKNSKWNQNIDFILSGGDYGSFLEEQGTTPSDSPLSGGESQGINKIPTKPKITDIRSKFTI